MAVRIVTDSTADLPADVVDSLGITVVPLHIYFGDDAFLDGVSIGKEEFYRRITDRHAIAPRTAAPSTGEFAEVYTRLADEADGIVSIHLSPKLSATHTAARMAAGAMAAANRIVVVDSATASLALGLLVKHAAVMAAEGATIDAIVSSVESLAPRAQFFGVLGTLEYLHKGGRIGGAAALLGSMLHIKPIIGLRDGVAYPIERVRGRQQAVERLIQRVASYGNLLHLAVGHTTDEHGMEVLASRLAGSFPLERMLKARCGATLGTYLGPGAFGVALVEAAH